MLIEHTGGRSLREVAERHDCSHETVRMAVRAEKRGYVRQVLLGVWVAQKEGDVAALAMPGGPDQDQAVILRHVAWLFDELRELGADPVATFKSTPDGGLLIAVEDRAFVPKRSH